MWYVCSSGEYLQLVQRECLFEMSRHEEKEETLHRRMQLVLIYEKCSGYSSIVQFLEMTQKELGCNSQPDTQ